MLHALLTFPSTGTGVDEVGSVRRDLVTAWLLRLLGRLGLGKHFVSIRRFDNALQQWLSRLPKLSCNLAGESRRFDWLGSAQLCEPKPMAWLGSAHKLDRLRVAQLRLGPATWASATLGKTFDDAALHEVVDTLRQRDSPEK